MEKKTKIIIVLIVLLLISVFYIVFDKVRDNYLQQGIELGQQQTLLFIAQSSLSCNQVPITIGNQTVNLINVGCLGG